MKTSDLAMLPHQTRSASTAITRPNAVARAGTMASQRMLLIVACWKPGSREWPRRSCASPTKLPGLIEEAEPEGLEDRIDQVEREEEQRRDEEQPRPDRGRVALVGSGAAPPVARAA